MGMVFADFTMSLDGFVAGPDDGIGALFGWYVGGDTPVAVHGGKRVFRLSAANAAVFAEMIGRVGALVTGRRDFEVSKAWGGESPFDAPVFIVTHQPPPEWSGPASPFTFVTEGVEAALARARAAVQEGSTGAGGEKDVVVSGTTIVQQCLRGGWLDEINIHLAPVLLGGGVRLFDHLGLEPRKLEILRVVDTPEVTHLRYRVVK